MRCTRGSFEGEWDDSCQPPYALYYLGREPLRVVPPSETAYQIPDPGGGVRAPYEDWDEGCPGGWLVCPFIQSFVPYIRQVGDYSLPNPRIHQNTDPLILEALEEYERHRRLGLKELDEERNRGR